MAAATISLIQMCTAGFWFCQDCERVTDLRDDGRGGSCCTRCGSGRIEFREPSLDAWRQPGDCGPGRGGLDPQLATPGADTITSPDLPLPAPDALEAAPAPGPLKESITRAARVAWAAFVVVCMGFNFCEETRAELALLKPPSEKKRPVNSGYRAWPDRKSVMHAHRFFMAKPPEKNRT